MMVVQPTTNYVSVLGEKLFYVKKIEDVVKVTT